MFVNVILNKLHPVLDFTDNWQNRIENILLLLKQCVKKYIIM